MESKHTGFTGTLSLFLQFALFLFLSLLSLTLCFFLSLFLGFVVAAFAL